MGSVARTMIVEDERPIARDLASTLVDSGYAVVGSVSTGEQAIILMDLRLAGALDGVVAAVTG